MKWKITKTCCERLILRTAPRDHSIQDAIIGYTYIGYTWLYTLCFFLVVHMHSYVLIDASVKLAPFRGWGLPSLYLVTLWQSEMLRLWRRWLFYGTVCQSNSKWGDLFVMVKILYIYIYMPNVCTVNITRWCKHVNKETVYSASSKSWRQARNFLDTSIFRQAATLLSGMDWEDVGKPHEARRNVLCQGLSGEG